MTPAPELIRTQILDLVRQYHQAKFADKSFDPEKDLVHYAGRVFDAEEIVNLVDAGLDFYLTASRYAERFEAEFADYIGLSDALLVNSGSSANLVALTALTSPKLKDRRLKPGDEVITTACGFPTTLNPILQNQLVPVFVDVNLGDYTAIPERLADAIGPKTKAVMMAHTMGGALPSRRRHGSREKAQSMAHRGQLRRPRIHLHSARRYGDRFEICPHIPPQICPQISSSYRHLRPPLNLFLLSGPSHHHGRRGLCGHQ